MTFTECLLASRQLRNTQKTVFYPPSSFEMAFFSSQPKSQYLNPPPPLSRKPSKSILHDDIDDFLSSDLEASFASSVSVSSPTREHPSHSRAPMYEPMDISPAPPPKPAQRLSSLHQDVGLKPQGRPRALTSGARLFGNDLSNTTTLAPSPTLAPEPSLKPSSGAKKTQRSALPMEWFTQSQAPALPQPTVRKKVCHLQYQLTTFVSHHQSRLLQQMMPWMSIPLTTLHNQAQLHSRTVCPILLPQQ